jgi:N-acetylglucosaminyldiphosphoundecaprenol N-acetyl-beta-D-mannosaminyltransferase
MIGTRQPSATRELFGIPLADLSLAGAVARVCDAIATRQRLVIGVVNAAKVVNMGRDAELRASVLASDLILADGFSVVLASRLLGKPLPERVAGIDLMHAILDEGSRRRYRVYCLGATEEVLAAVRHEIARQYPGVCIAGSQHGYFADADEARVAEDIRGSAADVLLVAMTSPKKERFLGRWGSSLEVPVCHGVGGSFDVLAGKVRRAPAIWQRLGCEWLYRVVQEPGRLWRRYLVTNTLFLILLSIEMAKSAPARFGAAGRTRGA